MVQMSESVNAYHIFRVTESFRIWVRTRLFAGHTHLRRRKFVSEASVTEFKNAVSGALR